MAGVLWLFAGPAPSGGWLAAGLYVTKFAGPNP
jgi:hypothetical protein